MKDVRRTYFITMKDVIVEAQSARMETIYRADDS